MPNLPTRLLLFLSAYTPLFLIMAVKYGLTHRIFGGCLIAISILSIALLLL
jgi:hypothetical protein